MIINKISLALDDLTGLDESIRRVYLEKDFSTSTNIRRTGFIAQEVEQAANKTGFNFDGVHTPVDENDNYSLAYSQFVVPLVKAVQEQQQMIENLEAKLKAQDQTIESMRSQNNTATGIANETTKTNYGLDQNIPNPFTHETLINYTLPTGIYIYSVIADGKVLDSKRIIVAEK